MTKATDIVMAVGGRLERINLAASPTVLREWLQLAMFHAYSQACDDCDAEILRVAMQYYDQPASAVMIVKGSHAVRAVKEKKKLEDL